jgi:hypothetical protein
LIVHDHSDRLCQPCPSGEQLALTFFRSLVGNALSVLLITLVMRVLVDIPLAALLSKVAIVGRGLFVLDDIGIGSGTFGATLLRGDRREFAHFMHPFARSMIDDRWSFLFPFSLVRPAYPRDGLRALLKQPRWRRKRQRTEIAQQIEL